MRAAATAPASTTPTTDRPRRIRRQRHRRQRPANAGRRAAQPGHPHQRRSGDASMARSSASIRRPARRCRTTRTSDRATRTVSGSSPTASAIRSASPIRPGTSEVWVGDVGWSTWEEINRIIDPTDAMVENFGWPCYEGDGRSRAATTVRTSDLREPLQPGGRGGDRALFHLQPRQVIVAGETCGTGSSSVSGLAFYPGRAATPAELTTARCSSPTTRATASGRCAEGRTACPNPPT